MQLFCLFCVFLFLLSKALKCSTDYTQVFHDRVAFKKITETHAASRFNFFKLKSLAWLKVARYLLSFPR